ncbi:hypothetical protein [Vibrio cholerae]|uniref:hypothetical protein n=1 Tax=Vibrio cholerae TaxID=666 RepID=UPI00053C42BB|nr:hypothetical protein [Vibrio cholerae]EGQ7643370.1 hypothetical protein [Vibrio cholerae]GHX04687.1 hypothetical protein VCSRO60_1171 [Vibrio cholerae]
MTSYFSKVIDRHSVVTAIDSGITFPELLNRRVINYQNEIQLFNQLVQQSSSSAELLYIIRTPKNFSADMRMSLLKLFRRCVSTVCDTEATKKITKIPTSVFVENYGHTFKDINVLKSQFLNLPYHEMVALASLLGEYDNRGEQGYLLTNLFFNWVETNYRNEIIIEGPRGAGKDIQLSEVFPDFVGDYPCDFIMREATTGRVLAIGFARYDSTRGGSQSDDRTGGNSDKVSKAIRYSDSTGNNFKLIFLADGPGLVHGDTWEEACYLDGAWNGNVRVTTLKTAPQCLGLDWLRS